MKALLVRDLSPTAVTNPYFAEKDADALFKKCDMSFINLEVA